MSAKSKTLKTNSPLKLYTKTGDKGKSNVIAGIRLPKHHPIFETLGTLDELNANLGLYKALILSKPTLILGENRAKDLLPELLQIQNNLLTCGALIAGSDKIELKPKDMKFMEKRIDYFQVHTHKDWYTKFLLPGGTEFAARVDKARTVCRRAERCLSALAATEDVEIYVSKGKSDPRKTLAEIQAYINRLSDYLFALRCYLNSVEGYEEVEFGEH